VNNIVYKIYNVKNNKFLIGSTNNWTKRKSNHLNELRNNKHTNNHLQYSWNKYGEYSFIFFIESKHRTRDKAYDVEQKWLDKFYNKECCYNENPSATKPPSRKGKKHSEEFKSKRRAYKHTAEALERISKKLKGNKNGLGYKHTQEAKQKISKLLQGKPSRNRKRISLISPQGIIYTYDSIKELSDKHNLTYSCVSKVFSGQYSHHKGWTRIDARMTNRK